MHCGAAAPPRVPRRRRRPPVRTARSAASRQRRATATAYSPLCGSSDRFNTASSGERGVSRRRHSHVVVGVSCTQLREQRTITALPCRSLAFTPLTAHRQRRQFCCPDRHLRLRFTLARRVMKTKAVVAVARELTGFIWAIGREVQTSAWHGVPIEASVTH